MAGGSGVLRGTTLIQLENNRLKVVLVPSYGGKVVSLIDKTTGTNHLPDARDVESLEAGGLWDREGIWPTANFSNLPFQYQVKLESERLEANVWADLGNLRVEKRYQLAPNSTRLALEATYRNIGPRPIRSAVSHVFGLAVGGQAGDEDFVSYASAAGLVKASCRPETWDAQLVDLSPSWWMVSDTRRGESLLLTFEPTPPLARRVIRFGCDSTQLEYQTRLGLLDPGSMFSIRWDIAFFDRPAQLAAVLSEPLTLPAADREGMTALLEPLIESAPASFNDLGRHILAVPGGLVSFSTPAELVRQPGPLVVETRSLRIGKGGGLFGSVSKRFSVRVDGKLAGDLDLASIPAVPAPPRRFEIPTGELSDGIHALHLQDQKTGDNVLSIPIAVADEERFAARIAQAQRQASELAHEARRSGDPSHLAAAASCEMRAEDARRKLILGPRFTEGLNRGYEVPVNNLDLKMSPRMKPNNLASLLHVLEEAEGWIEALARGADPFISLRGLFQKAFYSRVDGSLQPYTVYVPDDYDGNTPLPLLVLLHGSGGDQWEILQTAANLDGRSFDASALETNPGKPRFLLCAPLARGASAYQYLAEVDVLQMLDEIQRDFHVDEDRVYLAGWSMGGTGTWRLASLFPHLFAAAMPIVGTADTNLSANLKNVPVWDFSAQGDMAVNPGYQLATEKAAGRSRIPYHDALTAHPFVWGPQSDHRLGYRMASSWEEIESLLSRYERDSFPRNVALVANELRHNQAYWLRIDSFERYDEPARLDAEVEGNRIQLRSSNVRDLTLFLSDGLVDTAKNVWVLLNGQKIYEGLPHAELSLSAPGATLSTSGLRKVHGLSGPLSDVFYEPLLIVYGTHGLDEARIAASRREADAVRSLAGRGLRYFLPATAGERSSGIQVKKDIELTSQDIEHYHLVLVGTPESNPWVRRIQAQLPIRVENGTIVAGGNRFPGEDLGLRMIYPNPLNAERYVLLCTGVSTRALRGLGSIPLPSYGWLPQVVEPDVLITDQQSQSQHPRFLAAYTFDQNWRLDTPGEAVGRLVTPLTRLGAECTWGNFRADVLKEVAVADVALVEVEDHIYPQGLLSGHVTRQDLALFNTWSPIYTFQATGTQIKSMLEHMARRWLDHRRRGGSRQGPLFPLLPMSKPVAVSGFAYTIDRSAPFGQRIAIEALDPATLYRVAVNEYIITQALDGVTGPGYLGWLPEIEQAGFNEVEAQTRYFRTRDVVATGVEGRVREQ